MKRRGFILGLGAALAAPAVVRAESLMKVAALRRDALISGAYLEGPDSLDYEAGSWTPHLRLQHSGGLVSYASAKGRYTKIGNRVFVTATLPAKAGAQFAAVNGFCLPIIAA